MTAAEEEIAPTALARRLVAEGRKPEAEAVVARLVADSFGLSVTGVTITADWSSLNSLNGQVETGDGRRFFFKFHQEEGEEGTVEEYYRAELLQRAGLPVDMPAMMSRKPGHQILLYAWRRDRQLAAACLDIERSGDDRDVAPLLRLQEDLDRKTGEVYVATLHRASAAEVPGRGHPPALPHPPAATPPDETHLAGRVGRFYLGRTVALPGIELPWETFAALRWRINGIDYADTLAARCSPRASSASRRTASPAARSPPMATPTTPMSGSRQGDGKPRLVMFDPAFAGEHIPALLADVKATFHNIFAHPFWLYHPGRGRPPVPRRASRSPTAGSTSTHDWHAHAAPPRLPRPQGRARLAPAARRPSHPRPAPRRLAERHPPRAVLLPDAGDEPPRRRRAWRDGRALAGNIGAVLRASPVMAGSEPEGASDPFASFLDAIAP